MPWLTVACALLVTVGVISANSVYGSYVPTATALLVVLLVFTLKMQRSLLALGLVPLVAFTYARWRTEGPGAADLSGYLNQTVVFTASFADKPEVYSGGAKPVNNIAIADLHRLIFPASKEISGRVRLAIFMPGKIIGPQYQEGQILQIKGRVVPLIKYQQPWTLGLVALDRKQGVYCRVEAMANDVMVIGKCANNNSAIKYVSNLIDLTRKRITEVHLQALGPKSGSLLASMVLGDQAVTLDGDLLAAFRKVGLSHLVAASGFNLTVVTMITYWILRILCPDKRIVTLVVGGNVLIYALLAGLSASIVRAAITCMIVLIAKYFNRRLHGLATLSFGLMINIIIDPSAVVEPGGQLSYAATVGIICGAESTAKLLSFGNSNKFINIFSSSLAVVLMAQLAVLPVQIYHFWQMGMLFLPANLIIDPLVTPVTIIGFLASALSNLSLFGWAFGLTICQWLDWLAAIPLQMIIYVTETLAACGLAVLNTGQPDVLAIIIYYVMFAIWLISVQNGHRRLLSTVLFMGSLIALFYQPELKRGIIVLLPRSTICINDHRQGLCFGDCDRQTNKILAFYGANAVGINSREHQVMQFKMRSSEQQNVQLFVLNKGLLDQSLIELQAEGDIEINHSKTPILLGKGNRGVQLEKNCFLFAVSGNKEEVRFKRIYLLEKNGRYRDSFISKQEFCKQLGAIDIKICCPNKSLRYGAFDQQYNTKLIESILSRP